jgi:selenocysteine lyase/cysteine desulfurase
MNSRLSSGIVSFEIHGMHSREVVERLARQKIIASQSPYGQPYVRFAPGIYNTPEEIDKALQAIHTLM